MIKTGISAATFRCNCTSSADSIRDYSGTECSRRGSRTWEKFKNNFFLVFRFTCFLLQSCCSLLTSLSSCLWAASEGAPFGYILNFTYIIWKREKSKTHLFFLCEVHVLQHSLKLVHDVLVTHLADIPPLDIHDNCNNWWSLVTITSSSTSLKSLRLLGRGSWPGG